MIKLVWNQFNQFSIYSGISTVPGGPHDNLDRVFTGVINLDSGSRVKSK